MIGDKIKAQRLAMGLTQEELAARMGYKSKSTINKIELNINDIPLSKVEEFAREHQFFKKILRKYKKSID